MCDCCGCAGCAGCAAASSACACSATFMSTNIITNPAYMFMRGNIFYAANHSSNDEETPAEKEKRLEQEKKVKAECDAFDAKHVTYKNFSITLGYDEDDYSLSYIGKKQGERKVFYDDTLQGIEHKIENFEGESPLHQTIDRIL